MDFWFVLMHYASFYIAVLPLLFFIPFISKNKRLNPVLKVLLFYCICSLVSEFLSELTNHKTNWYVNNIYTLVEFLSIMVIYHKLSSNKTYKLFLWIVAVCYTLFFIIDISVLGNFNKGATVLMTSEAMIVIVLSILFFFGFINNRHVPELTESYLFWLNTAFLVYFSGSLVIFLFINYILQINGTNTMKGLWMIHLFFNILYNILMAKSIYTWNKHST